MKTILKITFLLIGLFMITGLTAQKNKQDGAYKYKLVEIDTPKLAPDGYEPIKTIFLNRPLYPNTTYQIGFWIFGRQLPERSYSFPIQVFPTNFSDPVNEEVFTLVQSNDKKPKLSVNPPPSYTSKGHFTFDIQPDTLYNYISIALKVNRQNKPPIDFKKDVTVTGIVLRQLGNTPSAKKNAKPTSAQKSNDSREEKMPATKADRILIDSHKTYTVSENSISIGLYDHRNIDRDIVTIYLNDQIVIKDYELKRKKKFFKAYLRPGINRITLHAENLGEVSPNTAAILIRTTSQEYMAVLESDFGSSQYFTLNYKNE